MEIGSYKIETLDTDHFLITYDFGKGSKKKAKITGGDLETVLGTIFTGAEITHEKATFKTKPD